MEETPPKSWRSLLSALEQPIYNKILKKWVGKGELDYEVYLKTKTLLGLQTKVAELVAPEELMFQIVHQSQELWMRLLSHEGVGVVESIEFDELWNASMLLNRMIVIQRAIAAEMHILETLTPDAYEVIRRSLGQGSGQESPGYNTTMMVAEAMALALERLLERRGVALRDIYAIGSPHRDIKRLCEQMLDFDEHFQLWLTNHFMLVRRTIGIARNIKALDGFPTAMLSARMVQPLFPRLWDVRSEMTRVWDPDGGFAPGSQRPASVFPPGSQRASAPIPPGPVSTRGAPTSGRPSVPLPTASTRPTMPPPPPVGSVRRSVASGPITAPQGAPLPMNGAPPAVAPTPLTGVAPITVAPPALSRTIQPPPGGPISVSERPADSDEGEGPLTMRNPMSSKEKKEG